MRNLVSTLFVCLLITACQSLEQRAPFRMSSVTNSLSIGMTKQEVVDAIGLPDAKKAQDSTEVFVYLLSDTEDQARYHIGFEHWLAFDSSGRLVKFGDRRDFNLRHPTTPVEITIKQKQPLPPPTTIPQAR